MILELTSQVSAGVFSMLLLGGCSNVHYQSPRNAFRSTSYCDMTAVDLMDVRRGLPVSGVFDLSVKDPRERERNFKGKIAGIDAEINFWQNKYEDALEDCEDGSRAFEYFLERVRELEESKPAALEWVQHIRRFYEKIEMRKLYYRENAFGDEDLYVGVRVLDVDVSSGAEFHLVISSKEKTRVLRANIGHSSTFLDSDGVVDVRPDFSTN